MKRKFVKVMFLGALALSTVTYVGCKDYDDEIDNLQTQIDANKASIAKLQEFVDAGKWVTNVEPIGEDGFKITFNDGKSYSIKSGKDGEQGAAGTKITVDPTTKNWIIDDKDTGICAEGKNGDVGKGEPGPAGYAPQISENGFWMVWNAETGKPEETDKKAAADMYITEDPANPLVWVLNVLNKETKEWDKVSLPKSARITSLSVLGVKEDGTVNVSSTEASATLYYGRATSDIEFNGIKKFKKKDDLLIARGGSVIHALINPVNLSAADIQAYKIGLTDSKGNTSFVVSNIADNVSDKALTRADAPKTANKGIYDLTLGFASGVTYKGLQDLDKTIAYALTTKDAWGNDIISQYGVKVEVKTDEQKLTPTYTSEKPINDTYKLDELVGDDLGKVVAYYYTVADADLKAVDATFDKDNNTIKANKAGTLDVKVNYLATDGETYEAAKAATLTITFTYVTEKAEINDMTWVVNAKTLTATSDIVGPSVDVIRDNVDFTAAAGPISTELKFADGDEVTINGKKLKASDIDGITLTLKGLNAKGKDVTDLKSKDITKYVIEAKFDVEGDDGVIAVPHTATVKFRNAKATPALKNEFLYETTFKITVQQNNDLFSFQRAGAYFTGDKATAYGTVYESSVTDDAKKVISFNLYSLYKEGSILEGKKEKNEFITFSVAKLTKKDAQGNEIVAPDWLLSSDKSSGDITVQPYDAFGGAYTERDITVTYKPFGNPRLNAIVDKIQLTVKSEIFEGEFKYEKQDKDKKAIGTKENPFEVDGGHSINILESEFKKEDVTRASYKFDDSRIVSVAVELADENARTYLTADKKFKDIKNAKDEVIDHEIVISKQTGAEIKNPPVCEVKVKITDKWGKVTSAPIYVKVTK